jgi:hypothetical protein
MAIKPELQKKLDNCAAMLKEASSIIATAKKRRETVVNATEAARKAIGTVKLAPPSFSAATWSARAQKLGANAAELNALKQAESKGTREACVAAAKVIGPNKKLAPILNAINATLKKDSEIAAQLKALQSKLSQDESLLAAADKLIP